MRLVKQVNFQPSGLTSVVCDGDFSAECLISLQVFHCVHFECPAQLDTEVNEGSPGLDPSDPGQTSQQPRPQRPSRMHNLQASQPSVSSSSSSHSH